MWWIGARHYAAASQGFDSSAAPPSKAEKYSSTFNRSQTRRLLIAFGFGILPSETSWSNSEGETPMYSAATTRDKPRGANEAGRALGRLSFAGVWGMG